MKKTSHFPILIEQDEDGVYIVSCPTFRGCHSYGRNIEEAMQNVREVIELCLAEQPPESLNRFVGFREIELEVA